ncbi:MAG: hypothetical protein KatS3mg102_2463 [Planctomycetota bacterium]|nr:MAG: hypothetical protein KatS3mg102_2463 [Planctomycetota bacterium]
MAGGARAWARWTAAAVCAAWGAGLAAAAPPPGTPVPWPSAPARALADVGVLPEEGGGSAEAVPAEPTPRPAEREPARRRLWVGGRGGVWFDFLELEASARRGDDRVDFVTDLDVDRTEPAPAAELWLTTRYLALYGDFFLIEREGSTTLRSEITFGGVTFGAATPVRGKFELLSFGGRLELRPLALDTLELAIVAGGRYYRLRGELRSVGPVAAEVEDERQGGLPYVGAALRLYPAPLLELSALAQGFHFEGGDDRLSYVELEGAAGLRLLDDHLALLVSYRWIFADLRTEDGDRWNLHVHGPALYLRLQI